jgi:hypothetical protein
MEYERLPLIRAGQSRDGYDPGDVRREIAATASSSEGRVQRHRNEDGYGSSMSRPATGVDMVANTNNGTLTALNK